MNKNYFIISKKNLLYNIEYIRNKLQNNTRFCAVLKADAYGHNAKVISKLIERRVDYFGVANLKEAIDLRKNGIKKPIIIFSTLDLSGSIKASKYDIEFTITDKLQVEKLLTLKFNFKVHVKINTGFNRLGVDSLDEYNKIQEIIMGSSNIKCIGVFTHFATAESDKDFLCKQVKCFELFKKATYIKDCIFHCSNTYCALNYPDYNYDMVRVGLGLYGYGDFELKPILSIKGKIIQVHNLIVGDRVGYNNGFIVNENYRIGIVALGYADGINRKLINYQICDNVYTTGNICMDMLMLKIDKSAKVGDIVEIFNNANDWAMQCGTIPYEILTSLSYKRMKYIIK